MQPENKDRTEIPDRCPHCHQKLSSWQQVLLGVDRAIICKNCRKRITLDIPLEDDGDNKKKENKN
ncbi:MAG TPA: hypothetical protein PK447_02915 [Ignavibacteria bacterium]|nr:hypothetical protein [Ignavibacteria bacterium]